MKESLSQQTANLKHKNNRHKRWKGIVSILACMVVFCTVYALILPALTAEGTLHCGKEEHTHIEDCYEKKLICGKEEGEGAHHHTDECYREEPVLVCTTPESDGHKHTDDCYTEEKVLTCTNTDPDHVHNDIDGCYTTERKLTCGKEEGEGAHHHTEECYETKRELICGQEENDGHKHTDDCYKKELVCGKEEHKHILACYSDPNADVEDGNVWQRTVSSVTLTGNWGADLAAIAKTQSGYTESTANYAVAEDGQTIHGYTRYGAWANDPYRDNWSAQFADFCLSYAGVPTSAVPQNNDCSAWNYTIPDGYTPKTGDLLLLDTDSNGSADHAGIVTSVSDSTLTAIVGDADKVVRNNTYNIGSETIKGYVSIPENPALATPTPEISYEDAMSARPDVLMATGRSDYPNQINNVIGFPYIFRGALDTQAKAINEEMKIAAVHAIANLAKQPVPDVVNTAYHVNNLSFGPEYFIPKPVDPRLITEVSCAVAKAAMESGVARTEIKDWDAYCVHLRELMGYESKLTRQLYDTARRNPQRVVFAEGIHPNMLKAAVEAKAEGICHPILLGNDEAIGKLAEELDLSLEGIEIVNLRHPDESERRERYSRILAEKRAREGFTYEEANDKMFERNYFGMMMVETGDADAFITGLYTRYSNTIKVAKEVIGIQPGFNHFGTMHILNSKKGTYFLADTLINRHPDTETLIDIAKLADKTVRFFNHTPVISMLSYSNFGADTSGSPVKVHGAVNYMQKEYPELAIDGEMQVNFAMNRELRDAKYPFTRLKGKDVNTLIFPNLSSANAGYKLLQAMDPDTEFIGPIQMGLNKPIHFTDFESSVRDIVNITAVAVIDAIVVKKKNESR